MSSDTLIREWLDARLDERGRAWFEKASDEISVVLDHAEFAARLSLASRYAGRGALEPSESERAAAASSLEGWNPERWTRLETLRVALVLSRSDLHTEHAVSAIEEAFRYADEGELCALYRSLAHLPDAERFAWRAGEGCRTNMLSVFEAVACDTPYPFHHFDDIAWNQAIVKGLFVGAPVWRIWGLDQRLSPDLARMALDLRDERRSAGREVQPELWLCLGEHGGERGTQALREELEGGTSLRGRHAACFGLARAGERDLLANIGNELESRGGDAELLSSLRDALAGHTSQADIGRRLEKYV